MSPQSAPIESQTRLRVLDSFRAMAILGVLAHHFFTRYAPPDHYPNLYGYVHHYPQWIDLGAMGVQFFFIISGFVIFMTLQSCHHLFEFLLRRFARLYPAYVIGMLMTFAIANVAGPPEFHSGLSDLATSLAFATPYVPGARFVEPAHWSLIVEVQFYVCIGLIYTFARERFAAAWIAFICGGCILWLAGTIPRLHALGSISRYVFLSGYVPYFTAGIVFYKLYSGGGRLVGLMAATAAIEYLIVTPRFTSAQHLTSVAMICAFTLFIFGRIEWIANRGLVVVGSISYSLYLLHQYIGVTLIRAIQQVAALPDAVVVASVVGLCGILAYGLWRFVEVPAKAILLKWLREHVFGILATRFPRLQFVPEKRLQPQSNLAARGSPPARMVRL